MKKTLYTLIATLTVAIATLAGCSPEAKARRILEKHQADFIDCDKKFEGFDELMTQSLKDANRGDLKAFKRDKVEMDALLDEAEACMGQVKGEIGEDKRAAGISDEVFDRVWDQWIEELQDEGKIRKPK